MQSDRSHRVVVRLQGKQGEEYKAEFCMATGWLGIGTCLTNPARVQYLETHIEPYNFEIAEEHLID